MPNADSAGREEVLLRPNFVRMLVFVLLLAFSAILECLKLSALRDPEIWGHLRIGTWILEHRSLPDSGLFSQASGLPWRDLSWGFDTLVALLYRVVGLRTLPPLQVCFRVALAIVTFLVAGGWRNFWSAAVLSAGAQYILFSIRPFATYVSLTFLGVELLLLLDARESGKLRALFALPLLLFLWANLDLGFVYGVVLYVLFLAVLLIEAWDKSSQSRWFDHSAVKISLPTAAGIGGACLIAGCFTPNTFHAYASFFAGEFSRVNPSLPGYTAMGFRQPQDYALMLLAMTAFLSLGLLRSRDIFLAGVLCGSTALAFYAQRDSWLLTLASVAVVGHVFLRKGGNLQPGRWFLWDWRYFALVGAALALTFFVFVIRVPRKPDVLLSKAAEKLPVHAADYLRQHPAPAPLFNSYLWGGFLTWYLPEYPVAIDARRGLYPEDQEVDYFKFMNAEIPFRDFPPMKDARTVLLDKTSVMGEALRGVRGFQVLYEDDISIVYSQEIKE